MAFKPRKIESAEVTSAFIDTVCNMAQQKLDDQKYGRSLRNVTFYTDLAKRVNKPGRGIDLLVTSLKKLPFKKFAVKQHEDRFYLTGITRPLVGDLAVYKLDGQNNQIPFLEVPEGYAIFLPTTIFFGGTKDGVHLIPVGHLWVEQRHFHHFALDKEVHPLNRSCRWCWFQFSTRVDANTMTMHIPGFFNMMLTFARIYGDHRLSAEGRYGRDPIDIPEMQEFIRRVQ
jgi:hypothetical protein